jgi:transcriptional regulator with XRE-family HTH domain
MENKITANKLEKWRLAMGYTIARAAKHLGISKSYMSMLESGERKPSADKRLHIEEKTKGQVTFKDWH